MTAPTRFMITGASAPLGAALVEALRADPSVEAVLAVSRESSRVASDARVSFRTADLTRPRALHDLLWSEARELGVEVVVHAIHHRDARDDGPRVHAQNVDAARELVTACTQHPTVRRLVYRSFAEVYALRHTTSNLIDEDAPLDFDPASPQWVRDRVEADLTVAAHLGGPLSIAVLRCAEVFAPGTGSQLWDYLRSRVCLRPLGFDPMINVLSLPDVTAALIAAARGSAIGAFNIPGRDTLPLSLAIAATRRADVPVPGPLLAPLYGLRRWIAGTEFRYDLNLKRFHFGGVLDGTRAWRELGYRPETGVAWPHPWWERFAEKLTERGVQRPIA